LEKFGGDDPIEAVKQWVTERERILAVQISESANNPEDEPPSDIRKRRSIEEAASQPANKAQSKSAAVAPSKKVKPLKSSFGKKTSATPAAASESADAIFKTTTNLPPRRARKEVNYKDTCDDEGFLL
jgi:hypothetical protein